MSVSQNNEFSRGGICAAVAAPDTQTVISSVLPILDTVDVVEVRLDAMHEINLEELTAAIRCPLLFTNRPAWEGGGFSGPEDDRILTLIQAAGQHPSFIDLELKTEPYLRNRLLRYIQGSNTRLILSHHNFETTPDAASLSRTLKLQSESGAHIGKIVTMAHNHLDVLRVLNLQVEASSMDFPLIAFCMGEAGKLSRVITVLLGGFLTYAALDDDLATAPGQYSISQLRKSLKRLV